MLPNRYGAIPYGNKPVLNVTHILTSNIARKQKSLNENLDETLFLFYVDFELKNEFLNMIMTKSFQFGLDKIADAFQKRAEDLFGSSILKYPSGFGIDGFPHPWRMNKEINIPK